MINTQTEDEQWKRAVITYPDGTVVDMKFSKGNHRYYVDGHPAKISTSAVQKVLNSEGLNIWRIKEALRKAASMLEIGKIITEELKASLPVIAAASPDKKRDEAADEGTEVHERLELWVKEGLVTGAPYQGGKLFVPKPADIDRLHDSLKDKPQALHMSVQQFGDWLFRASAGFTFAEKLLYSKQWEYPGTADCGLVIGLDKEEPKTAVGDYKIRSGVYAETRLQTAAYQHALQEMGEGNFTDNRYVFLFGRAENKATGVREFTGDFQAIEHDNYDEDFEIFTYCLATALWLKKFEKKY